MEKAEIRVHPATSGAFEAVLPDALPLLREAAGCRSVNLLSGVERSDVYLLLVEWDSVQAHQQFTTTPEFARFVGLVKDFFNGPTGAEHFTPLDPAA